MDVDSCITMKSQSEDNVAAGDILLQNVTKIDENAISENNSNDDNNSFIDNNDINSTPKDNINLNVINECNNELPQKNKVEEVSNSVLVDDYENEHNDQINKSEVKENEILEVKSPSATTMNTPTNTSGSTSVEDDDDININNSKDENYYSSTSVAYDDININIFKDENYSSSTSVAYDDDANINNSKDENCETISQKSNVESPKELEQRNISIDGNSEDNNMSGKTINDSSFDEIIEADVEDIEEGESFEKNSNLGDQNEEIGEEEDNDENIKDLDDDDDDDDDDEDDEDEEDADNSGAYKGNNDPQGEDEDDDVAVVLSSDEEEEQQRRKEQQYTDIKRQNLENNSYNRTIRTYGDRENIDNDSPDEDDSPEEDDDDDDGGIDDEEEDNINDEDESSYDDDDLMDDVCLLSSSANNMKSNTSKNNALYDDHRNLPSTSKSAFNEQNKLSRLKEVHRSAFKKEAPIASTSKLIKDIKHERWNFRMKIKRRSIKWLIRENTIGIGKRYIKKSQHQYSTSPRTGLRKDMLIDVDDDDDDDDEDEDDNIEDDDDEDDIIEEEEDDNEDITIENSNIETDVDNKMKLAMKIKRNTNENLIEIDDDSPVKEPKNIVNNSSDTTAFSTVQNQQSNNKKIIVDRKVVETKLEKHEETEVQQKQNEEIALIENKIENAMESKDKQKDEVILHDDDNNDDVSMKILEVTCNTTDNSNLNTSLKMNSEDFSKDNNDDSAKNIQQAEVMSNDELKNNQNSDEFNKAIEEIISCTSEKEKNHKKEENINIAPNDSEIHNINDSSVTEATRKEEDKQVTHKENDKKFESCEKSSNVNNLNATATTITTATNSENVNSTLKRKRSSHSDDNERNALFNKSTGTANVNDLHPIKKLKIELESSYPLHNKILSEYIEKTSNNTVNEIQKHIDQLLIEMQTLNDMINKNEIEWQNMIHLKKVKEEIMFRLKRKKHVIEVMSSKLDDNENNIQQTNDANLEETTNKNSIYGDGGVEDIVNKSIISTSSTLNHPVSNITSTIILNNKNNICDQMITSTPNNTINNNNNSNNKMIDIPNNNNNNNNNNSNNNNFAASSMAVTIATANVQQTKIHSTTAVTPTTLSDDTSNRKPSTAFSILESRANMKTKDLVRERNDAQKIYRNILPKPSSASLIFGPPLSNSGNNEGRNIQSGSSPRIPGIPDSIAGPSTHAIISKQQQQQQQQLHQVSNPLNKLMNNQQQQTILNSCLTAANIQQQLEEISNGHLSRPFSHLQQLQQQHHQQQQNSVTPNGNQTVMVGRQGVFRDVKSIIADYRQNHPDTVPKRGRRLKGQATKLNSTETNSILGNVFKNDGKLINNDYSNSRPSSNDSSHSMNNVFGVNMNNTNIGNLTFKDVLVQFAKSNERLASSGNVGMSGAGVKPGITNIGGSNSNSILQSLITPPYPEVTLHPVVTTQSNPSEQQSTGSLLHGILTKHTRPTSNNFPSVTTTSNANQTATANYKNSFSPTLARLLTAPERITSTTTTNSVPMSMNATNSGSGSLSAAEQQQSSFVNQAAVIAGLNLSKVVGQNSEITITPVSSSSYANIQSALLQRQKLQELQEYNHQELKELLVKERLKSQNYNNLMQDDDADDNSVDRLVIDEGNDSAGGAEECHRIAPHAIGQEFHENEVPICQGCKKQEAQFVCAGCGNQWYCSRECQVNAWDEHSEVCTG